MAENRMICSNGDEDSIPATNVHASDILVVLPLTDETDSIAAANVDALMNNDIPLVLPLTNAQDGIDFYNKYAKVCGFIPRLDSTKLVNGIITHKRCVCNKEDKSRNKGTKRKRTVTRTGCEAKVSFKRIDTGEYQIYDFVEVHTHAMVTPATMVHMKPSRNLNLFHKKMIMDNSRVNHGPVDSFRMFKEYVKGYINVGASLEDFKNFSRDVKKYIKEYDAEMLLETFMQKKAMSPSFYFDFEVDDEKSLSKSMFDIRSSWIPAYFRDIYLGGIMRTTSRSESENSFFGNFTNPHLTLVEFWMRFQSAMDAQRWKYAKVTTDDKNSSPKLSTPLLLEKKTSEFYTTTVFYEFQEELQAACFSCGLSPRTTEDNNEHISIMDREKDKVYKVDLSGNKFSCSCKMFERIGLLCKHVLSVLKDRGFDDIPREYLLDRWSKYATCRPIFNVVGTTLLADCMSIENHQSKISELWSEVFTSVSLVEDNEELGDELLELLRSFNEKLMISVKRGKSKNKKPEIEMLIGSKIPTEASVLPPEKCKNKGSGRRITSNKEKAVQENAKPLRKCRACGEMTHHDSRNCPSRVTQK
ncbi:protein FAR1-RELATED SEQUENCE 5-like [Silene latifolia]|uniref:protein FAR1-RELATED SEQUENCE 5-like n=1 Tax=Silene latifolia TaxID=37657 RepID=UPI003D76E27A